MNSSEAANWMISNYRIEDFNSGDAYVVIQHRSWLKEDQVKLADYFLGNIPHVTNRGYKAFLTFMSLPRFLRVIEKKIPKKREDRELLKYYLYPLLKNHPESQKHQKLIKDILSKIE
ncbi:hypothetical protein [Rhodospirillum sp. A1_3_36]|uniref:hypothetical protein n=1 Tax=Rhodospirillum sp. A1_3_36 TaxID=3391666 RepID=UPI0039A579C6